ncbi:MAG: hypothetical protein HYX46_00200 [Betaproteobacteria bacterium]|nr:hypothetical protein [Betaproteobacteria bacterium]
MRAAALLVLVALSPAVLAFDVNGVALGGREHDVRKAFPSAYCKPLEWKTSAADRRCDDGQIAIGGVKAKITFYLKADAIQGFDVRFDTRDRDKVVANLRSRWGAPLADSVETFARKKGEDRKVHKVRWEKGNEHAVLTAQLERKRATLEAWRGNFAEEIYRVR